MIDRNFFNRVQIRVIKNVDLLYSHNADKNINSTARSLGKGLVLTNNNNCLALVATKSCRIKFLQFSQCDNGSLHLM